MRESVNGSSEKAAIVRTPRAAAMPPMTLLPRESSGVTPLATAAESMNLRARAQKSRRPPSSASRIASSIAGGADGTWEAKIAGSTCRGPSARVWGSSRWSVAHTRAGTTAAATTRTAAAVASPAPLWANFVAVNAVIELRVIGVTSATYGPRRTSAIQAATMRSPNS